MIPFVLKEFVFSMSLNIIYYIYIINRLTEQRKDFENKNSIDIMAAKFKAMRYTFISFFVT